MPHPKPPYSYDGTKKPEYALVGKPVCDEAGSILTFHLVLENTASGVPATSQEMKSFMQEIVDRLK